MQMTKKAEQPALTIADVEIIKERISNMTPEEQAVVASELDSSIMESELASRRAVMGAAVRTMANEIRKVGVVWAK